MGAGVVGGGPVVGGGVVGGDVVGAAVVVVVVELGGGMYSKPTPADLTRATGSASTITVSLRRLRFAIRPAMPIVHGRARKGLSSGPKSPWIVRIMEVRFRYSRCAAGGKS